VPWERHIAPASEGKDFIYPKGERGKGACEKKYKTVESYAAGEKSFIHKEDDGEPGRFKGGVSKPSIGWGQLV